jgi:hypothetical protein
MSFARFTNPQLKKLISIYKDHVKFSETAPSKMKRAELLEHVMKHFTYNENTGHIKLRTMPELSVSADLLGKTYGPNIARKKEIEQKADQLEKEYYNKKWTTKEKKDGTREKMQNEIVNLRNKIIDIEGKEHEKEKGYFARKLSRGEIEKRNYIGYKIGNRDKDYQSLKDYTEHWGIRPINYNNLYSENELKSNEFEKHIRPENYFFDQKKYEKEKKNYLDELEKKYNDDLRKYNEDLRLGKIKSEPSILGVKKTIKKNILVE